MSVRTRPAILLATASVAVGLLLAPDAAVAAADTAVAQQCTGELAADEVCLSPDELTAAMETVQAASVAAGAEGWQTVEKWVDKPDSGWRVEGEASLQNDPINRRLILHYTDTRGYEEAFAIDATRGTWEPPTEDWQASVLKMMGRSSVKWVFTAGEVDFGSYLDASPAVTASYLVERLGTATEVTKTIHGDGSADYRVANGSDEETLHVSAASVITGRDYRVQETGVFFETSDVYSYGPQSITLPSATSTIDAKTLKTGRAYLSMADLVKKTAGTGATSAQKAAKGGKVTMKSVRSQARRAATSTNGSAGAAVVKIKDIKGGVRVYATNPWTKKSVAYTVTASGKKAVVKKVS
ncbi:hypothetical protein [Actinoplanes regularis]|uniref:hypothetical protein n=1 Tax=Actinoplanes regularis TaxID=52697 RepID=UPI0024A426F6|nr:hypothetical protein [Actinoplanes regularis]GLW35303.1 hypothetical protein Areg01_82390 [Actinoplanes regularis]